MNRDIRRIYALGDIQIRAYTSEKLRAHTAQELVEVSKRLFDRSRLEIVLTNKLDELLREHEELLQELEKINAQETEGLDEDVELGRATTHPRKSKIANMVSSIFGG